VIIISDPIHHDAPLAKKSPVTEDGVVRVMEEEEEEEFIMTSDHDITPPSTLNVKLPT
jgi:hypothetical protein